MTGAVEPLAEYSRLLRRRSLGQTQSAAPLGKSSGKIGSPGIPEVGRRGTQNQTRLVHFLSPPPNSKSVSARIVQERWCIA